MPIPFGMSFLSLRHLGPFWTLVFTNLALLVSALIQAVNRTISFHNAIIVIYLCFLHSFSSLFVLNILHWVHRKNINDILSLLQILVLSLFAPSVLLADKSFGYQAQECNSGVHVTPLLLFCQWLTYDSSGCPLTF